MDNASYQREILNQAGLDMLNLCLSQIEKATEAFLTHDSDLAEEVINTENRVNALDIKIEKDCEKFIALYNPVAIDLRFIMAIRKINFDLERIADHAYNISKYIVDVDKKMPNHLIKAVEFEKMYDTISSMFDNVIEAYKTKNVKVARKVFKKDKTVDVINVNSFNIIEDQIKKDQTIIAEALILFSVVKKLERVGDLIKNISEEIIFYIDAEVIKHKQK
jgi:phosphate transport system protein